MTIQAAVYVVQTLNRDTGVWEDKHEEHRIVVAIARAQTLEHSGYRTRVVSRQLGTYDPDPVPSRTHLGRGRHGR